MIFLLIGEIVFITILKLHFLLAFWVLPRKPGLNSNYHILTIYSDLNVFAGFDKAAFAE